MKPHNVYECDCDVCKHWREDTIKIRTEAFERSQFEMSLYRCDANTQHTHNIWLCHCEECDRQRTQILNKGNERMKQIEEAHKKVAKSELRFA